MFDTQRNLDMTTQDEDMNIQIIAYHMGNGSTSQ